MSGDSRTVLASLNADDSEPLPVPPWMYLPGWTVHLCRRVSEAGARVIACRCAHADGRSNQSEVFESNDPDAYRATWDEPSLLDGLCRYHFSKMVESNEEKLASGG